MTRSPRGVTPPWPYRPSGNAPLLKFEIAPPGRGRTVRATLPLPGRRCTPHLDSPAASHRPVADLQDHSIAIDAASSPGGIADTMFFVRIRSGKSVFRLATNLPMAASTEERS